MIEFPLLLIFVCAVVIALVFAVIFVVFVVILVVLLAILVVLVAMAAVAAAIDAPAAAIAPPTVSANPFGDDDEEEAAEVEVTPVKRTAKPKATAEVKPELASVLADFLDDEDELA
jgi:hypothetical protein